MNVFLVMFIIIECFLLQKLYMLNYKTVLDNVDKLNWKLNKNNMMLNPSIYRYYYR